MKNVKIKLTTLLLFIFLAIPCFSEEFTLGLVQQQLHAGMPQSDIVSCLGAPNMVVKNSEGCETWVYNKTSQSTRETYNKSWFWLLFAGRRKGCQSTETSQKSLTVVLNFNKNACLETFTYNTHNY